MLGERLGGHRLVRELGSGAMATVYLAEAGSTLPGIGEGEPVAVKVAHPHLLTSADYVARFLQEARIGRDIQHPNVVRTLDAGTDEMGGKTLHFLVMEYVEGQTLRFLITEEGLASEQLCRHIGMEVAQGLAAVHAAGIIHRDLKPANVLITQEQAVKVMDLGVARMKDEALRLSQTGQFAGSVPYAAPEQFRSGGKGLDGRADLYALGLLLYELATGHHVFPVQSQMQLLRCHLREKPARPSTSNPQLSPFLEEVILRLLEKDRSLRFPSADEVAATLRQGERSDWWRERSAALREETHRPLRRMRIPRETALFGRDREVERLRELWVQAKEGNGQAVLLEGEAGVGKSRLIDEFVAILEREGEELNFVFGDYPPGGAATSARAFSTAYHEQLGDAKLEERLRELLPNSGSLAPSFAAFLRGAPAPERAQALDRDAILTVFVKLNRGLASERPTLVLIDDLHFAPDEGRALFAAMAHALGTDRLLLVGTFRPALTLDFAAELVRLEHTTLMRLGRLPRGDVERLLSGALGSERSAEQLTGPALDKSDGNPYLIFEYLAALRNARKLVRRTSGTWSVVGRTFDVEAPPTMKNLVESRIGLLDEDEREILEVAACCGFRFDPLLIGEALDRPRISTLRMLGVLERRHRIVHSLGRHFEFDHHLVQEVLYEKISLPLREAYHGEIGRALEGRHKMSVLPPEKADGETVCSICHHLLAGQQGEQAMPYLEAATSYLESSNRNHRALDLTEAGLNAPGLLTGKSRADALLRRYRLRKLLGRSDDAEEALLEVSVLFEAESDPSSYVASQRELGRHYWETGKADEAMRVLEATANYAARAGDASAQGSILGDLGNVNAQAGRYEEAEKCFQQSLEVAKAARDVLGEAKATGSLALNAYEIGRPEEARTLFERCLPVFREHGVLRAEATAIGILGLAYLDLGRFHEARNCHERHLEICRQIGYRRGEANALGNLGQVEKSLGRWGRALDCIDQDLRIQREIGDVWNEGQALVLRGIVLSHLGDHNAAEQCQVDAIEIFDRIDFSWGKTLALRHKANLASERNEAEVADQDFEEAVALARSIGKRVDLSLALLRFGGLRLEQGLREEARDRFEEALKVAREASLPDAEVLSALHLALLGGDLEEGRDAFDRHRDLLSFAYRMEAHYLLWAVTGDDPELEAARTRLEELRAHAPAEYRGSMIQAVRLHRRIQEGRLPAGG